jgi:hypothetical protein
MKSLQVFYSTRGLEKFIMPMKILVLVFALLSSLPGQTAGNKDPVTVVAGESWLDQPSSDV